MEEFRKLWDQFDRGEIDKLNLEKSNLCHKMLDLVDEGKKKEIQWELDLLGFIFVSHWVLEYVDKATVHEMKPFVDKLCELCDEDSFEYFKKRCNETKSLLNKSRYALVCWLIQKKKDSIHIEEAISCMIKCALKHRKDNEPIDTIHLLSEAYNLASMYNIKKYKPMISEAVLTIFYEFENTEHARWMMEPVQIFTRLNKEADYNLVNNMITVMHREAHKFLVEKKNYHLHQSLLEVSIELCDFANLDAESKLKLKNEIITMMAESNEMDAEARYEKGEGLGAVFIYGTAQKLYQKTGNQKKVEDLSNRIRVSSQKIQWKEITYKMELPILDFKGNNGYELVRSIAAFNDIIPRQQNTQKTAEDILQKNPLMRAVSTTYYNRKNPVSHNKDEKETLEGRAKQLNIQHIKIGESWLASAVKKLEEEKRLSDDDFIKFISDFNLHDKDSLEFVMRGIRYHFQQDYVGSIHVLIPQVENTLRLMLNTRGISTVKVENRTMTIMESQLGGLLGDEEVKKVLGNDLTSYLKVKFADVDGINLRNDVSHALLPLSEFNHATSFSLIQVIMILTSLSLMPIK